MIAGLYVPGESVVHNANASVKLFALLVLGIGLVQADTMLLLFTLAGLICILFTFAAGLGLSRLWQTTRPLLIWLVFIVVAQIVLASSEAAWAIVLRIVSLVWAAALVTYTTRLSDMTDSLVLVCGWLRPLGVPPQRVGYMIALTIRLIPALSDIVQQVREAQRARGIERSIVATVVPVLTRVFQQADAMSDALQARGYEHWDVQSDNSAGNAS